MQILSADGSRANTLGVYRWQSGWTALPRAQAAFKSPPCQVLEFCFSGWRSIEESCPCRWDPADLSCPPVSCLDVAGAVWVLLNCWVSCKEEGLFCSLDSRSALSWEHSRQRKQ